MRVLTRAEMRHVTGGQLVAKAAYWVVKQLFKTEVVDAVVDPQNLGQGEEDSLRKYVYPFYSDSLQTIPTDSIGVDSTAVDLLGS